MREREREREGDYWSLVIVLVVAVLVEVMVVLLLLLLVLLLVALSGISDFGLECDVPKYELIDPDNSALVDAETGRLWSNNLLQQTCGRTDA